MTIDVASGSKRFYNNIIDLAVIHVLSNLILGYDNIWSLRLIFRFHNINNIEELLWKVVFIFIYYLLFESLFSITIGKLITKTTVVHKNGEKPSFVDILLRTLSRLIPFDAFSFLGSDGIGWHDKFSKTRVVNK